MFFLLVKNLGHEHERLTNAWHKKEYQTISGSPKKSKAIIHSLHLPGWKCWNCNLLCKEQTNANLQFETAVCSVRSRQMLICWLNSVSLALSSWIKKIMESGVCVVIMSGVSFSSLELRWPSIALNSYWCQFVYQSLIRAIIIAIIMDNKRSNLVELDKCWCKWEFSSNKLCEDTVH